eukprot:COSAG06_NODE_47_length_29196_cov_53.194178_23_plen_108_part_00
MDSTRKTVFTSDVLLKYFPDLSTHYSYRNTFVPPPHSPVYLNLIERGGAACGTIIWGSLLPPARPSFGTVGLAVHVRHQAWHHHHTQSVVLVCGGTGLPFVARCAAT